MTEENNHFVRSSSLCTKRNTPHPAKVGFLTQLPEPSRFPYPTLVFLSVPHRQNGEHKSKTILCFTAQ
ncbi:hypothetical protein ACSQ67_012941 [Phaseolus vulgaris]